VNSRLTVQIAVGIFTPDGEGGTLDPGLFTLQPIQQLALEAVLLRPAQIHAQQHFGPILGLGTACTGVNRHQSALLVVVTRQLELQLELVEIAGQAGQEVLDLFVALAFGQELVPSGQLLRIGSQAVQCREASLQVAPPFEERRAGGMVIPESGRLHLPIHRGQLLFEVGVLKETPEGRPIGVRAVPSVAVFLLSS
jgi:hypothetical protein